MEENVVYSEHVEWKPRGIGKHRSIANSDSVQKLRSVQVGQVVKIVHPDVTCHSNFDASQTCSLKHELERLRQEGWVINSYHEDDHIIVMRRLK
jgi:hypothetical protein